MKKILKAIFTWIWCFPQMYVGLLVKIVTRAKKDGDHYRYNVNSGSVTLGTFIFLCPTHWDDDKVLRKGIRFNLTTWVGFICSSSVCRR